MQDFRRAVGALSKQISEEMKGFSDFMGPVLKPGRLDLKTKELFLSALVSRTAANTASASIPKRRWLRVQYLKSFGKWPQLPP
jgi:hypothetical protein